MERVLTCLYTGQLMLENEEQSLILKDIWHTLQIDSFKLSDLDFQDISPNNDLQHRIKLALINDTENEDIEANESDFINDSESMETPIKQEVDQELSTQAEDYHHFMAMPLLPLNLPGCSSNLKRKIEDTEAGKASKMIKGDDDHSYPTPPIPQVHAGRLLWEFLQDLLNDPEQRYTSIIVWRNLDKGIFKIVDPNGLAQLWGIQKKSTSMNYDKLSRALRYYYKDNILQKFVGEHYCYQ